MAATMLTLTATRIAGEVQTPPATVYLNPELVSYGIGLRNGTNLTYKEDENDTKEYEVTETITEITDASNEALLNVPLVRFMGESFKTPKGVLLNAGLISSVRPATNPDTGASTYSLIAYNREGKLNEQFLSSEAAQDLSTRIKPGTGGGGTSGSITGIRVTNGTTDAATKNIVIGHANNAIEGGNANTISGGGNAANYNKMFGTDHYRTIAGGYDNWITGAIASSISGGAHHRINPTEGNTADHAHIGGGSVNIIKNGSYSTIGGGTNNTIELGQNGTIGGGVLNVLNANDGTIAGGNTNSVTGLRGAIGGGANNVVGSSDGAITGGSQNNINDKATGATISGGVQNKVTPAAASGGNYSFIGGGFQNEVGLTATAQYANVGGGRSNKINASYGAIPGGRDNEVTGQMGVASGQAAKAYLYGQRAHSAGMFTAKGDAQDSVLLLRKQTTDATPTELRLDNSATKAVIPSNTTWLFTMRLIGKTAGGAEVAAYESKGVLNNNAGTVAFIGTPTLTELAKSGAASWSVAVNADNTSKALSVMVTGAAAKNINWVASLYLTEALL